MRMHWTEHKIT